VVGGLRLLLDEICVDASAGKLESQHTRLLQYSKRQVLLQCLPFLPLLSSKEQSLFNYTVCIDGKKKGNIPIGLEPMTTQMDIERDNHYTNKSFASGHHGPICHVGAGLANCPDSELAEPSLNSRLSGRPTGRFGLQTQILSG
jgi:hypothetical protein